MPDISKINALAIGSVGKVDGLATSSILDINGITVDPGINPTAPTSGFLFTYSGAAVAYSVRQLNNNADQIMRVRRASDNVEADVGFDAGELKLTSPISNTSDALSYTDFADFVDHTGTPTDAFVRTWYDQTGLQFHAEQETEGNQPQIYDATTGLIEEGSAGNEKPALNFNGDVLSPSISAYGDGDFSVFVTAAATTSVSNTTLVAFITSGASFNGYALQFVSNAYRANIWRAGARRDDPAGSYTSTNQGLWSATSDISTDVLDQYLNAVQATGSGSAGGELGQFNIGARNNSGTNSPMTGTVQEVVLYNAAKNSTDRTGIETDINTYFSIY